MKKLFLFLLAVTASYAMAQQPYNDDGEGKCHRFHSFKNRIKAPTATTHVADTYNPHYMHIKMNVSSQNTTIAANVSTSAKVTSTQLDTIYMELNSGFSLDSVKLNGNKVAFNFTNSEIFVVLSSPLSQGDDFSVHTFYHGSPSTAGGFFKGLNNETNWSYNKKVTWTLSEPFSACDWLSVRQSLAYKIDSVYQEYTCASNNMVGSNGILTQTVTNNDGSKTFHWKTNYPIAYYLLSFSVSDYREYNVYAKPTQMNGDSVLIQNFIYNSDACLNYHKSNIDKSKGIMEVFSDKYGLYPFHKEKYGNCLSEIGGGMEHQTMTTLNSFSLGLNAHEMGHQWFGDNITCATWSDIWVNEGFASYSSIIAKEFLVSSASALSELKYKQQSAMGEAGGSVYVPTNEVYYGNEYRIFSSRLTYNKGAAILHQLRYLINDDSKFFGFLNHYSSTFAGQTATGAQVRDAMEAYTGLDLHPYFEQWYYGEGYPTYSVECQQGSNLQANFTITQTTSSSATRLFTLPLEVKISYANGGGDSTFRMPITANTSHFSIQLPKKISNIKIDPNNAIINKTGNIFLGSDKFTNALDLVVGPNPAHDLIQITFSNTQIPTTIDIYDISGHLVQTQLLHESGQHIDISSLPKAFYMVQATQGNKQLSKKIMKL